MPTSNGTFTPEDVADWLGVTATERIAQTTEAARQWVINRRSLTPEATLFFNADVHLGAILYAALLFQSRSTPSGYSGYDENATYPYSAEQLYRARDLVGSDPVFA